MNSLGGNGIAICFLLLGFDRGMNLLEIAYHIIDEQRFKVFHAMKCRNSYHELLRR
jgi:hypothetical protein